VAVLGCCCAALVVLRAAGANDDEEASQANPDGGPGIYAGMAEEQQGWGFVGQGLESRVSQMPVADADGAGVDTADAADTDRAIEAWQEKKRQASIAAPDTAAGGEAHFGTETAADGATQNQAAGDSDDAWVDDAMSGATWQGFAISPLAGAPGGSEGSQMETHGAQGDDDDYLALGNVQDSPQ